METKQTVIIVCGGASYEHEVSIITGLQVAEMIDRTRYNFHFVYADTQNRFWWLPGLDTRQDFKTTRRIQVDITRDNASPVLKTRGWFSRKVSFDVVYDACHGGMGENGTLQGLLELQGIPFTSAAMEGSVIAMNKVVTKEVLAAHGVPVLPSRTFSVWEKNTVSTFVAAVVKEFSWPVIVKPVHLGSSIGIEVVHDAVALEKQILLGIQLDTEVLVEPALTEFTEYNVAVRQTAEGVLECSPIEEPKREADILSFDDKYANGSKNGSKKTGGAGMELLDRTLPAKIEPALAEEIITTAKQVYRAARLSGMVRIDFMYHENALYCTEINPIPGSMAFYLWEAAGEQFTNQITNDLEQALLKQQSAPEIIPYETDIVEKYLQS